jgi:hypothetical protein
MWTFEPGKKERNGVYLNYFAEVGFERRQKNNSQPCSAWYPLAGLAVGDPTGDVPLHEVSCRRALQVFHGKFVARNVIESLLCS